MSTHPETQRIIQSLSLHKQRLQRAASPAGLSQVMLLPELPPLGPTGGGASVSRSQVEAFSALYYHAEIETTGLLVVAELLARERDGLNIRKPETYQALQTLADAMHGEWHDEERRQLMFGNVFRFGAVDDFRNIMAQLTGELQNFADQQLRFGNRVTSQPQLEMAFQNLLREVAARSHMGLERAATILGNSLKVAVNALSQPELQHMVRASSIWGLVGAIFADQFDQQRIQQAVERAEAGAPVIAWCATRIDAIGNRSPEIITQIMNDATLQRHAVRWNMNASAAPRQNRRGGWA